VRLDQVKILVLDEVDRMLDMGFQRPSPALRPRCRLRGNVVLFARSKGRSRK